MSSSKFSQRPQGQGKPAVCKKSPKIGPQITIVPDWPDIAGYTLRAYTTILDAAGRPAWSFNGIVWCPQTTPIQWEGLISWTPAEQVRVELQYEPAIRFWNIRATRRGPDFQSVTAEQSSFDAAPIQPFFIQTNLLESTQVPGTVHVSISV